MRLVEKILGVAGVVLLGMSLGVGLSAARERRFEARSKRRADTRVRKAETRARKEAEAAAAALIAEKARHRAERRKTPKK